MASRVNTRFVVVLGAALFAVFAGVAGLLWVVRMKSGERYIARGDAAIARADAAESRGDAAGAAAEIETAERFYSIAVNKGQQNVEWLNKWRAAMRRKIPRTPDRYVEDFRFLLLMHRQLAIAQKTNVAAHREYLDMLMAQAELGGGRRQPWDGLASEAALALRYFTDADPPGWQVLRRYRGIARISAAAVGATLDDDALNEARQDIEAALKLDPGDAASASALARWHMRAADEARRRSDRAGEQAALDAAVAAVDGAWTANRGNSAASVARLRVRVERALRDRGDTTRSPGEAIAARRARLMSLRPVLDETVEALRQADPGAIGVNVAFEFLATASLIDPGVGEAVTNEIADRVLSARPQDMEMAYLKARMLMSRGEYEPAIARMQSIIDLPLPPVSFEGVKLFEYRRMARFLQANAALALAASAPAGPERTAAERRADQYRAELLRLVPDERSPEVLFIDAKRALTREDLRTAERLLDDYSAVTGDATFDSFEALTLAGHVATRLGQKDGKAAALFERALDKRPDSIPVLLALAEVQARMQQYESAQRHYRHVLDLDPENKEARERSSLLEALLRPGVKVDDPVQQALVDADRLMSGAPGVAKDPDGAIRLIEQALDRNNADPRLVLWLVGARSLGGDTEGAQDALAKGLAAHPDDEGLKAVRRSFDAAASPEEAVRIIDEANAPEVDKLVARYQVFRQRGMVDRARETLAALSSSYGSDPRTIEFQFVEALDRGAFDEASRLADRARDIDADRAEGLTFRARIQIARGDLRAAAATLQQAAARANVTVTTLRLYAQVLLRIGSGQEAIKALRDAQRLNPSDRDTIKALILAMIQVQDLPAALRVAREAESFARFDLDYQHLLLELEAQVGDRSAAIAGRERIQARRPKDARNGTALIGLYLDAKRWKPARDLIDSLRADADSLALASLEARWHADQGDMDAARQAFLGYLDKLMREQREPMTPAPWLAFGDFLVQRGETDAGLAAMARASEYQSEKREADLYRADRLISLGRFDDAAKVYRDALAAGAPDPERTIASRLIEALVQSGKIDDAEAEFTRLGPAADSTMPLMVLWAAILERRGDTRAAREMLNRTVERFPQEAIPYYRRALLTASNPAFLGDAIADLDQALRLRPDLWQARVARANMNFGRDRIDDAFNDLRAAVEEQPRLDEPRFALIGELLRLGRTVEAVEAARAGVKLRPNDQRLNSSFGDMFSREKLWDAAAEFYTNVWAIRRDEVAGAYAGWSLLRCTPPRLADAENVLAALGAKVSVQPGLLQLRAKLRALQGQGARADNDLAEAYNLSSSDPQLLAFWHDALLDIYPDPRARLRILERCPPKDATRELHAYMRALASSELPDQRADAMRELARLLETTSDRAVGVAAARTLQELHARDRNFEAGLEACRKGLAFSDADLMLNNNAAAFLNEELSRPAEALPYALKAAELAPTNPSVLDTLAGVYVALKDAKNGEETCVRGLRAARGPTDKAKFLLFLARLRVQAGDRPGAQRYADQLRRVLIDAPNALTDEQKRELDEMERAR